ncbi:unnamed protein product [Cylindrotheca closterium]|uniref:UBC core domain-containing protein n=1 Tax=Cylindrotheca closterium TaxID=2856 RepID=A0AAD2FCN3_9STRA|nr:unnamed protein product [Cylindrotheca closterium]
MAPAMATARLRKELMNLKKAPPPDVLAEPDESNILKWFYGIRGASGTAFEGGIYIGKLVFPPQYPMKPPSIYMMTPSGRFEINTKLCMSMSDFHPESWNPMWSVSSIIQGVQSFMASDELTTGGLKNPPSEHKKYASLSAAYNAKMFPNLFGGDMEAAFVIADKARIEAEANSVKTEGSRVTRRTRTSRSSRRNGSEKKENDDNDNGNNDDNADNADNEDKAELTPEEIEKRRQKNAKKRAKQKAKKAAQKQQEE